MSNLEQTIVELLLENLGNKEESNKKSLGIPNYGPVVFIYERKSRCGRGNV